MEVGPLARYIIGYAKGDKEITVQLNLVLKTLDVPVTNIKHGDSSTHSGEMWDPADWPSEARGVGFSEAPRGALGHWIKIKDTKIDNYQCVVPTTWNGSPRDEAGNIGAFEASMMNTRVAVAGEPVEILRNLHSFDPCLACSTHVMSEDGKELAHVTTGPVGS